MATGRNFPTQDPAREDRAMADRLGTENREISEDERLEAYRLQSYQSSLPDLPRLPGWHMIWLSTTNQYDSIVKRQHMGYVPLKPEDVPGWDSSHFSIKTGEYQGLIGWNEMVAFKLPQSLFEKYARHSHHDAPMEEERRLKRTAEGMKEEAERHKGRVVLGDGVEGLAQRPATEPDFSGLRDG